MFNIGISSEILRTYSLLEAAKIISNNGYDTIEIWMGHFFKSNLDINTVKELMRELNLNHQLHADIRDVNLTSTNKGIQEESYRQTLDSIEIASAMDADVLTIHPGRMSSSKDISDNFWENQINIFKKIANYAEKYNVLIGVENMEKRSKEIVLDQGDVEYLIKSVDSPNLGLTMDLAHYSSVGDLNEFVEQVDVPIYNVHISQASSSKMHLPLYRPEEGKIAFDKVLNSLKYKYSGPLIIESYQQGKELEIVRNDFKWLNGKINNEN